MDINLVSTHLVWDLVITLVKDGTTIQSYRKRAHLMKDNFVSEFIGGLLVE